MKYLLSILLFATTANATHYSYTVLPGSLAHINFHPTPSSAPIDLYDGIWTLEHNPEEHTFDLTADFERLIFNVYSDWWYPYPAGESGENFFNPIDGSLAILGLAGTMTLDGVTTDVSMRYQTIWTVSPYQNNLFSNVELSDVILNATVQFNGPQPHMPEPASLLLLSAFIPFMRKKYGRFN